MKEVIKHERFVIAAAAVVLILVGVLGVLAARQEPSVIQQDTLPYGERPIFEPKPVVPEEPAPEPIEPEPENGLTQASCEAGGGTWNECGSACRGAAPGTPCILMCVPYCECATDEQCPADLSCGAFIDGTGICQ